MVALPEKPAAITWLPPSADSLAATRGGHGDGDGDGARASEGKPLLALLFIRAAERCRAITGKVPLNGPGLAARPMASRRLKSAAFPPQARRILLRSIFGSGARSGCASSFRNRASKLRSCSAFEVRGKAGKCNCGAGRGKVY